MVEKRNFDKNMKDEFARDSEKFICLGKFEELLVAVQKYEYYLKFKKILKEEVRAFGVKETARIVQIAQEHFVELENLLETTTCRLSAEKKARTLRTARGFFLWWVEEHVNMAPEFSQMMWEVIVGVTNDKLWLKRVK